MNHPSPSTSFVDPTSLSLPTPPNDHSSASPASTHSAGPSRKRPRTDMSPEERKDARAHRNRLAAQHSRDKRKAQFSALERRVAELEEENRQLRAGIVKVPDSTQIHDTVDETVRERELAREKENEDLRERVRSLEKGWEAVVKALSAHGLPAGISLPAPPSTSTTIAAATEVKQEDDLPSATSNDVMRSTTTFPVLVPDSTFPLTPMSSDSPLSNSSLFGDEATETTRHLAAGALDASSDLTELALFPQIPSTIPTSLTLDTTTAFTPSLGATSAGPPSAVDEATMETLFREILTSPSMSSATLPYDQVVGPALTSASAEAALMAENQMDWTGAIEMQRLLDMLPVQPEGMNSNLDEDLLDMELANWEYTMAMPTMALPPGVNVS